MQKIIGPFELLRELGRGGMGVVYLANDTRLDRQVAIKSLPPELASDPPRLERFEREAKTLASLSHPNLAGIHGVEEQDGSRYLVLEYVEGVSLADVLDTGPIPVADAIEYAKQIAAGMEAAHESGVIHRDLKPANIMITPEGGVKILDFGLARADEGSASYSGLDSPTMTTPQPQHSPTIEGAILGTAAYMSPEQARGRRVDKRTDIWSFGVVLYEMLAGMSPFHGETATDSIGAVLHKDLDLALLPKETPASVRRILRRCLVRDPAMRYRDIGDVRVELMAGSADEHAAQLARGVSIPILMALALVAICLTVGAFYYARTMASQPEPKQPLTFAVDLLSGSDGYIHGASRQFSLSRDGSMLVVSAEFEGKGGLWVRRLDQDTARLLPGTEAALMPVFSPDGNWIAYFSNGALMRVPTVGGSPQTLAGSTNAPRGVAWIDETRLAYTPNTTSPVMTVDIGGSEPVAITDLLPESESVAYRSHRWPVIEPTNRYVVYTAQLAGETFTESSISAVNIETGVVTELVDSGGAFPIVLPNGDLLYNSAGTIYRIGVEWGGLKPVTVGSPDPVLFDVVYAGLNGSTQISVADNGSLIYVVGDDSIDIQSLIAWLDLSTGKSTVAYPKPVQLSKPIVSDDGRYIAFNTASIDSNMVIFEPARQILRTLSVGQNMQGMEWAPDNRTIVASRAGDGFASRLHRVDVSGEIEPVPLAPGSLREQFPTDWSPDGSRMVYMQWTDENDWDLHMLVWDDPDAEPRQEVLLSTPVREGDAAFSPDGQWIAYESPIVGDGQIFVRRVEGNPARVQISVDGGELPYWGPDGRTIYYTVDSTPADGLMAAAVMRVDLTEVEGRLEPGLPVKITDVQLGGPLGPTPQLDIHPDGTRMVYLQPISENDISKPPQTFLVTNWFDQIGSGTLP